MQRQLFLTTGSAVILFKMTGTLKIGEVILAVLIPAINEKQTIKNVKKLLSDYHRVRRLAGAPVSQHLTSVITDTPIHHSQENTTECRMLIKLDAEETCTAIHQAIDLLEDEEKRLLKGKYLSVSGYDYETYTQLAISKTTYYSHLNRACIHFAESYNGGELVAYQT